MVEVLSDHPGVAARSTEIQIEDQHRRISEHHRAVADLRKDHAASRRWWQWGKWLRERRELREFVDIESVVDRQAEHRLA